MVICRSLQRQRRIALGLLGAIDVALTLEMTKLVERPRPLQDRCLQFAELPLRFSQLLLQCITFGDKGSILLARIAPGSGNIDAARGNRW